MHIRLFFFITAAFISHNIAANPLARAIAQGPHDERVAIAQVAAKSRLETLTTSAREKLVPANIITTLWERHPFFNRFRITQGPHSDYPTHFELLYPGLQEALTSYAQNPTQKPSFRDVEKLITATIEYCEKTRGKLGDKLFYNTAESANDISARSLSRTRSFQEIAPVFSALCFASTIISILVGLTLQNEEHPESPANQAVAHSLLEKLERYFLNYMYISSKGDKKRCSRLLKRIDKLTKQFVRSLA